MEDDFMPRICRALIATAVGFTATSAQAQHRAIFIKTGRSNAQESMVVECQIGRQACDNPKRSGIAEGAGIVAIAVAAGIVIIAAIATTAIAEMAGMEATGSKIRTSATTGASNVQDFMACNPRPGLHAWDNHRPLRIVRAVADRR
jgi:hypothetical protein